MGDRIFYIGFNIESKKYTFDDAIVLQIDSVLVNGAIINKFFFNGKGIPGYSGGPIFNKNSEVVGILDQATYIVKENHPPEIIGNIGYSLNPVIKCRVNYQARL